MASGSGNRGWTGKASGAASKAPGAASKAPGAASKAPGAASKAPGAASNSTGLGTSGLAGMGECGPKVRGTGIGVGPASGTKGGSSRARGNAGVGPN